MLCNTWNWLYITNIISVRGVGTVMAVWRENRFELRFYVSGEVLLPAFFSDDKVLQSPELNTVLQHPPPGLKAKLYTLWPHLSWLFFVQLQNWPQFYEKYSYKSLFPTNKTKQGKLPITGAAAKKACM